MSENGSGSAAEIQRAETGLRDVGFPTDAAPSTARTHRQLVAKTADDLIAVLADLFPGVFAVYEARRRPLRVGIHGDLKAALEGAATGRELGLALSRYCGAGGYLRALKAGAPRIGLDGRPAGSVDLVDAAHAEMQLDLRRRKRRARQASRQASPAPSPASPPPHRRLSLGDLRVAAAARKAARL
jgi:sRNA-binding protein